MAIALQPTEVRPPRNVLRPVLVLIAALILGYGVVQSGGFQLPEPRSLGTVVQDGGAAAPQFDNRGKWTGY